LFILIIIDDEPMSILHETCEGCFFFPLHFKIKLINFFKKNKSYQIKQKWFISKILMMFVQIQ